MLIKKSFVSFLVENVKCNYSIQINFEKSVATKNFLCKIKEVIDYFFKNYIKTFKLEINYINIKISSFIKPSLEEIYSCFSIQTSSLKKLQGLKGTIRLV